MKYALMLGLLLTPFYPAAQTVYGKLLQEIDTFETDHALFVKGGMIKLRGMKDSLQIAGISKRLYADRTIVVAHVSKGRQIILDDGRVRFPVTPRTSSNVLYARDSALTATELYQRCILWAGKYFPGGTPIDVQDPASAIIIVKPSLNLAYKGFAGMSDVTLSYTLSIRARPGRIRIDQENYTMRTPAFLNSFELNAEAKAPEGSGLQPMFSIADRTADAESAAILDGLQEAIDTAADDW